ncbi:MAG TPA: hypothetical protein ENK94_01160 [Campylobacterales bacterium]|nr:hypothetical protein [Campylobacterales bacterium]
MNSKLTKLLPIIFISFLGCSHSEANSHVIAKVPEASGISFCEDSNSLMVANDEGSFYELSPKGDILAEHRLGKYDLEGVVCEKENIVFAEETGSLLIVNRKTLKVKELKLKGKSFKLSKKAGIEGIAKKGDLYYLSIQAKTKEDSKILVAKAGANHAKVVDVIEHGIIDSAGLQFRGKTLYIVSDKKDKLYLYNLKKGKIKKKIKLDKFAQEGITFDNQNNIYFADDDGAVRKYSNKELKLPQ